MCNAMKAAERAKAAEQESWATKEMEWAKEKANLLDAYEKCRQGLERVVLKLKEEKEKQTAIEERRRAAWGKGKLKSRFPATSESGGESTRGPTPVEAERANPKPTRRMAATGGPGWDEGPLRGAAGLVRRDLGAEPRWERSDGGGSGGWSTVAAGSETGGAISQLRTTGTRRRGGWTGDVPLPTPGRGGGGRGGQRPNTARWCEEIGQKQISSPLPGGV